MSFYEIMDTIDGFLWGTPFLAFVILVGLYFTIRSGMFTIAHFPHVMKHTLGSMMSKEANAKSDKHISPFEAVCVAIGGCVGNGNISGVATAVATGGPGAILWMWIWAFFGMMVKCVETALSCYYRSRDEEGKFFGGTTFFVEKGLVQRRGIKAAYAVAGLFGFGFVCQFLGGSQAYSISETLYQCFGIPMIAFTLVYSLLLFYIIFRGVPRIAKFASRAVPFMCVAYVVGGLGVILMNVSNIPAAIGMIFHDAFTGTAAVGGFAGAVVAQTVRTGMARSINSNEAGQGSSPLIHGSADTIHPIRQGLWGAFEVFVDTGIICSVTALTVMCSGVTGSALVIEAFRGVYGQAGVVFLGVMMLFFGITTTSGWFSYYLVIVKHALRSHPDLYKKIASAFRFIYPLPNIIIVSSIVLTGNGPDLFWIIVDITLALPVFGNLLAIFLLRKDFFALLKDYKARFMGQGTVDPDFKPFYDEPPMPGDGSYEEYMESMNAAKS